MKHTFRNSRRPVTATRALVRVAAGVLTITAWLGGAEPIPLVPNGGFEDLGADGKPVSWQIRDALTTVRDQATEGKRALRIEDRDAKLGTDIQSAPFAVQG